MSRYVPKSIVCLREGYRWTAFVHDGVAGLTVGIIALPLAMAFGIASIPESVAAQAGLSPPAMGLYTAVVAGFLISALGGSRVQIGGPPGAFGGPGMPPAFGLHSGIFGNPPGLHPGGTFQTGTFGGPPPPGSLSPPPPGPPPPTGGPLPSPSTLFPPPRPRSLLGRT